MELEEYRIDFLKQLRFEADHEGTDPEAQFLSKLLENLENIGVIFDPNPMSVEMRGKSRRLMAFDAYSYDEADNALVLISCDFSNDIENVSTLTNSKIEDLCVHMRNFLDEAVSGNVRNYCDASDPAIEIAKEFKEKIGKGKLDSDILRFKFIIISNSILNNRVKDITQEDFLDRPVTLDVWTLERLFQTFASDSSEIITIDTIDFGCTGIPFLKADLGADSKYDAFMGIIPGKFLADIYLKYGSKLLQGNVRAFLSAKGKVNSGIRKTIANNPENFFTYNNGVALMARSVVISSDGTRIISFKDLQIINGGQTTASLANAIIRHEDKKGMNNLFVPMKLTVLNIEDNMTEEDVENYNEMTSTISRCANCQNPVTEADFFSNHPFHVAMERLSRKVMAPAAPGKPYQTIWFYERSRGKWEQEQMKLNQSQRKIFAEKSPKNQVVKKEKLAKCFNTILMNPHQVCQSSAINFNKFADYVERLYAESKDSINEEFFKKGICSVIMFDELDSLISKAEWYPKGGNKAQIIPYAIAKLMTLIPKNYDLDWKLIWNKQMMYKDLADELMRLAEEAHFFLMKQANGGIVRTVSRTLGTWDNFKKYEYELSNKFRGTLISKEETKADEAAARKVYKFNSNVDLSVEIYKLGFTYWMDFYKAIGKENILSFGDHEFIKSVAGYIQKKGLPTQKQCDRLMKIVRYVEDKGFVMS